MTGVAKIHTVLYVITVIILHNVFFSPQIAIKFIADYGVREMFYFLGGSSYMVPGLFVPPVTVIMLSPGVALRVTSASLLSVSIGSRHIV